MSHLSPESRAILAAAGDPAGPSPRARSRMKRALALQAAILGTGAAAGTAATSAAAGTATAMVAAKAMIALVIVGGATAGSVWTLRSSLHRAEPVHTATMPRVEVSAPATASFESTAAPPSPTDVRPTVAPAAPSAHRTPFGHSSHVASAPPSPSLTAEPTAAAPTAAAPTAAATIVTTLAAELQDIRAAQGALQHHDPQAALTALDRHEARFPAGTLREERRSLRVSALCALGRQVEARAEGARLLAENPRSPQAARVRSSCAGDPR